MVTAASIDVTVTSMEFDVNEIDNMDVQFSTNPNVPQLSLGLFHWVHATKVKFLDMKRQFANKRQHYMVVNEYSLFIDDDENGLAPLVKKSFKKDITTTAFCEVRELCMCTNIINKKSSKAFLLINSDEEILASVKTISDHKSNRYESVSSKEIGSSRDVKKVGDGYDVVFAFLPNTGDGITSEQSSLSNIFVSVNACLSAQKDAGNAVFEWLEMLTEVSVKLITILKSVYKQVLIIRPLCVPSDCDRKYVVCIGYIGKNKTKQQTANWLEAVVKNKKYITNICGENSKNDDVRNSITKNNVMNSNNAFAAMNKMLKFVEESNFFGGKYGKYREKQISSCISWKNAFVDGKTKINVLNSSNE